MLASIGGFWGSGLLMSALPGGMDLPFRSGGDLLGFVLFRLWFVLPVSLLIGLGSVVWGKAAYETRGLAWPIAAHFLIDVAVMAAYFV